jgi:cold shock CspA family protein
VKRHDAQRLMGIITELHSDYGILFSADGRKIYFHAHSVVEHPFDELREGMGVAFVEERGREGPQASSLRVVDGRGHGRVDERPPS